MRSSPKVTWIAFVLLTSFIFGNLTINAQGTDVTSDITTDSTWTLAESPYLVKQSVSVTSGNTLTIQAGVVVKFTGYFFLSVQGALVVSGTPQSKVTFTYDSATPLPGDWDGIRFAASSDDSSSRITCAVISYATVGLYLDQSSPVIEKIEISNSLRRGINLFQSSSLIADSLVHDGLGTGIKATDGSPVIRDTELSRNVNGVVLINSNALLQQNVIRSNGIGLLLNSSSPSIIDNEITLNQEGIEADFGSHPTVEGNTFSHNSKTGFWLLGGSTAILREDIFVGNGVAVEIEASEILIEQITVSSGGISLRVEDGSYAEVWNSSLMAMDQNSLYLEQGSRVVLTNTSSDFASLHIELGCTLYVRNFLTVTVLGLTGLPVQGAVVTLRDNGAVIAGLSTGTSGSTSTMVVFDRTYSGRVSPDDNVTTIEVKYVSKDFERNPREVDMTTSRTEVFQEKAASSGQDGWQSGLLPISLIGLVILFIAVLLLVRRRKNEGVKKKPRNHQKREKSRKRRSR